MPPTDDATTDRAFTLRMPPDLAAALREQAQAHDRSQGAEVRTILRASLTKDVEQPQGMSGDDGH